MASSCAIVWFLAGSGKEPCVGACLATLRQYRRTARENHPDKGGDQDAFVKLQAAKDS